MATLDRDWNFVVRDFEVVSAGGLTRQHINLLVRAIRDSDAPWTMLIAVQHRVSESILLVMPDEQVLTFSPTAQIAVERHHLVE